MLKLSIFLFLLELISATKYSVTIMNDSKLGDKQGAVHTWLSFDKTNEATKYFSFEGEYMGHVAGGVDSPGACTAENLIENRVPTEKATVSITDGQYQQLIDSSSTFCANPPAYDLIPNGMDDNFDTKAVDRVPREEYNCVTASNKILQSANIGTLSSAQTPYHVKDIIRDENHWFRNFGISIMNILRRIPYVIADAAAHQNPK